MIIGSVIKKVSITHELVIVETIGEWSKEISQKLNSMV
jgi:hypothetical protein